MQNQVALELITVVESDCGVKMWLGFSNENEKIQPISEAVNAPMHFKLLPPPPPPNKSSWI